MENKDQLFPDRRGGMNRSVRQSCATSTGSGVSGGQNEFGLATCLLARAVVTVLYVSVAVSVFVSTLFRKLVLLPAKSRRADRRRLLMVGTFYNAGWFQSHIQPLVQCPELDEVIVVCDEPLEPLDGVRYACPSTLMKRVLGRGLSRFVCVVRSAYRFRPETLMGYHIMPNALICLVVARWFGRDAIYQMTGGPIQIVGGGFGSENALLSRLGKASRLREGLLFHLLRRFDHVVVRGTRAQEFVRVNRLNENCSIITGSVDVDRFTTSAGDRDYDLVYVSRLVPRKGLEHFVALLSRLVAKRPHVRAAVLGDGPLREHLDTELQRLGVARNITFFGKVHRVAELLGRSRVFVLLSPSEGMSIAMLEAMASGLPVVVTNVGDLADLVTHGDNGYLVESQRVEDAISYVLQLLDDESSWTRMSNSARAKAVKHCSINAIAQLWADVLAVRRPIVSAGVPLRSARESVRAG